MTDLIGEEKVTPVPVREHPGLTKFKNLQESGKKDESTTLVGPDSAVLRRGNLPGLLVLSNNEKQMKMIDTVDLIELKKGQVEQFLQSNIDDNHAAASFEWSGGKAVINISESSHTREMMEYLAQKGVRLTPETKITVVAGSNMNPSAITSSLPENFVGQVQVNILKPGKKGQVLV